MSEPEMRLLVVAPFYIDALDWLHEQDIPFRPMPRGVEVVTPSSRHRLNGLKLEGWRVVVLARGLGDAHPAVQRSWALLLEHLHQAGWPPRAG